MNRTGEPAGRSRRRAAAGIAAGLVVSVLSIGWVFSRVDRPADVVSAAAQCRWPWVLAAISLRFLLLIVKNLRWRTVLRALCGRRPEPTWAPLVLGYFGSCFLPLRGGELIRIQLASARTGMSRATLLSTVVTERLIDGAILCVLLAVSARLVDTPGWIGSALRSTSLVLLAGVAVLLVLSFPTGLGRRFESGGAAVFVRVIRRFREGLAIFRRRAGLLPAVTAWTVSIWAADSAAMLLVLRAFGIPGGYASAMLLTSAVTLALTVPTAPGNLGPHQAVFVAFLGVQGVPAATALAASLTSQLGTQSMLLLAGAGVLGSGAVRWSDLRGATRAGEDAGTRFEEDSTRTEE